VTLRTKVSLVLSLLLMLSIGVTGGILLYESAQHTRFELRAKHQLLAENRAFALHDNLDILEHELARIASLPQIDFADKNSLPEAQLLDSAHQNSVLYNAAVLLINADGECVGAVPDRAEYHAQRFADRAWFTAARRNAGAAQFYATDEPLVGRTFKIVEPVIRSHAFAGVLVGMIALDQANLITPSLRDDLPPHTESVLVDGAGRVVFPPDRLVAAPSSDWSQAIARALRGTAGTFNGRAGGEESLFAFAPVKSGSGFAVVFRWPWSSLVADLRREAYLLFGILALGIVVAAGVGLLLAAYVTRPLAALSESAGRIARDEDPTKLHLPPASGDELGALVRAFEHMAEAIRGRDHELRNAMSKTAAMIAHELKNSLNGLGMAVELILQDPTAARVGRLRPQVIAEITRLRDMVDSLLSFSRAPRITKAPEDLTSVIARAIALLEDLVADRGARIAVDAPAQLPLLCDGHKIQGVVMNLVKNAVEAGHVVKVRVRSDGADAIVEVADDGPGLSDEARRHLFEPFFTTKPNGTGLGLLTSLRYVEAHGGRLEAATASELGGALLRMRLPADEVA
jgi:signal transduction histidine kinase